jgi:hypothetical protein
MPNLNQTRNKVNVWFGNRWQAIVDRQLAYMATHGNFWQGLYTHTFDLLYTTNVDAEAPGDNLTSHPTDQAETWVDIVPEWAGLALPARFVCDVYEGPLGEGFSLTAYMFHNGALNVKAQQYGPETWRAYDWQVVL